jgi:hypothetical protein
MKKNLNIKTETQIFEKNFLKTKQTEQLFLVSGTLLDASQKSFLRARLKSKKKRLNSSSP